jgi:hypothetical protein
MYVTRCVRQPLEIYLKNMCQECCTKCENYSKHVYREIIYNVCVSGVLYNCGNNLKCLHKSGILHYLWTLLYTNVFDLVIFHGLSRNYVARNAQPMEIIDNLCVCMSGMLHSLGIWSKVCMAYVLQTYEKCSLGKIHGMRKLLQFCEVLHIMWK